MDWHLTFILAIASCGCFLHGGDSKRMEVLQILDSRRLMMSSVFALLAKVCFAAQTSSKRTLHCGSYSLAVRNFYAIGMKATDFANSCATRSARLDTLRLQTNHGVHDRNETISTCSSIYPIEYSLVVNLGSSTGFE